MLGNFSSHVESVREQIKTGDEKQNIEFVVCVFHLEIHF